MSMQMHCLAPGILPLVSDSNENGRIIQYRDSIAALAQLRWRVSAGSVPCSATIYPKTNRYRLVFFRPFPPVLARVRGLASRAPPPRNWCFRPRRRLSVLRFLWWPRERSRGHFLCWRGFRGGRLWLATPVAVATQGDNMLCYALFCREKKPY